MMGYGHGYNMMGGGIEMMFIPIILIAVVIYLVYKQSPSSNFKNIVGRDNPLDILNERYARGEINEEEYNHKKSVLSKHI